MFDKIFHNKAKWSPHLDALDVVLRVVVICAKKRIKFEENWKMEKVCKEIHLADGH